MAFLSFGKKKKEGSEAVPQFETPMQQPSPMDHVVEMQQKGFSNDQIAQSLQQQGYNAAQISDAINQASFGPMQAAPEMTQDYGMYEQQYPQQQYPQEQQMPMQQPYPQQQGYGQPEAQAPLTEDRMQEIAEAIIDEKWEEFAKDIKKVIEWKEKSEDRLAKLEQQLIDLRLSIDSLTKSIMGKITQYDQNILDVGTEVKAMEKVFQKVLPSLTESVNKLDRMTKTYKEPPKK